MRIQFGSFELDDERVLLTREGRAIALRPKVFDLLLILVRQRARVVRREELFEQLWSSTAVGSGSLSGLVNELRSALGESGRGPSSIRTVHARGYQFVAAATAVERTADGATDGATEDVTDAGTDDGAVAARGVAVAERTSRLGEREAGGEWLRAVVVGERREGTTAAPGVDPKIGPHAWVACLPGGADRSTWLAERAVEARSAGYRLRHATARGGGGDEVRAATVGQRGMRGSADGPENAAASRPVEASPIALLLDVADPAAWQRAGGLRRLLDLLGRMPVLVVAAIAASPDDPVIHDLLAGDERIGRFDAPAAWVPEVCRLGGARLDADCSEDELAALLRTLSGLALASGPSFERALRKLGFAAARHEPIRTLRRVESSQVRGPAARPVKARPG